MEQSQEFIQFMHRLADASDLVTQQYFREEIGVENKLEDSFDPVTIADKAAERAIRSLIEQHYPDHGIIGEEYGSVRADADYVWVLDPIDGTRAYISGLPIWGTLIGLLHKGKASVGMMSQPHTRERFFGDGTRSFLRYGDKTRPLKTRACIALSEASMFTTSPALFNEQERPAYDHLEAQVRMPRYGTDCYGYAMVAAGQCDLVVESGLQIYDIAALIPIVHGAGGIITNWQGDAADQGGQILACGDKNLHQTVLRGLQIS
ncbi:MAG: histidinol-phosphatase [Stappiaceae bacterium]